MGLADITTTSQAKLGTAMVPGAGPETRLVCWRLSCWSQTKTIAFEVLKIRGVQDLILVAMSNRQESKKIASLVMRIFYAH